jgi:hypothetical protein
MPNIKCSIGFVPYNALGDSLIGLVIAENLVRNGYEVTVYGDFIDTMKDWLPQFTIHPEPTENNLQQLLNQHDLLISDVYSPLLVNLPRQQHIEATKKIVTYSTYALNPDFTHNVSLSHLSREKLSAFPGLSSISTASGRLMKGKKSPIAIADSTMLRCEKQMGLKNCTKWIELNVPAGLEYRKHKERVAIFPTTGPSKEYPAFRFMRLADKLLANNFTPVFIVTPPQLDEWSKILSAYTVISFNSMGELANYLYESSVVVSNDSGGGHLASFLNIPNVVITRRTGHFSYRPSFRMGKILRPVFYFKWLGKRIWTPFVGVNRIYNHIVEEAGEESV